MIIEGHYNEQDWFAEVICDGEVLDPKPSQKVRNHSPDGFAWGYSGSGPAQLALAILLQAGLSRREAVALYQRFKAQFLAGLDRASFHIEVDIPAWVVGQLPLIALPSPEEDDTEVV